MSVLVRTTDPNITEELVEQYFDLPHGFVKVISPVAGKCLRNCMRLLSRRELAR